MLASLLIELLTEELPPKSLRRLAEAFATNLVQDLKADDFVTDASVVTVFSTPRRLAVHITEVAERSPDRPATFAGPAISSGLDKQGQPTPALLGFAKKNGVTVAELTRIQGAKGEQFAYQTMSTGDYLVTNLEFKVEDALRKLPVQKLMRWGECEIQFVRPVHSLVMLYGSTLVPGTVLGLPSGQETRGHRFMSTGGIALGDADSYESVLKTQGKVIANIDQRKLIIQQLLDKEANGAKFFLDELLLEEVAGLVEYPVVYSGQFNPEFLNIPQECLILSMKQHQRYFPLRDDIGKLVSRFLMVSNIETDSPEQIIRGNERVLRARLSDAKFFYEQDKKIKLEERIPKLANVVYHNKLGSQLERVDRIQKLAVTISEKLSDNRLVSGIEYVQRAAYLCKADLLTDMVGEFPELQGTMGYYYALHDGENTQVAEAIKQHYDRVPQNPVAICVGLADKLDTLVGIYGVGLIPTGEKDPFALRRNALSVLRILAENSLPLNLMQLLEITETQFPPGTLTEDTATSVYEFMMERLPPFLREKGFTADEIDAVLSLKLTRMDRVLPRLRALQEFRKLPEAASLAGANKRIKNILRQAQRQTADTIDNDLLSEPSEKNLAQQLQVLEQEIIPLLHSEDYTQALTRLASLRPAIDEFFDKVMVMSDDLDVRENRLTLLSRLSGLFMHVADLSRLQS
jgi:glycyl-tRNA synthetase beta chain